MELMVESRKKPDIIVMTEMIPKAQKYPIMEGDIRMKGYQDPYINFCLNIDEPGHEGKRGIAVYVSDNFQNVEQIELFRVTHIEAICICLKFDDKTKMIVMGVYRSPSANGIDSTKEACQIIEEISKLDQHQIVIAGDFNYPEIDWASYLSRAGPSHHSNFFLQAVQENMMHQMVENPTRFRHGQSSNILDLILCNDDASFEDLIHNTPVGSSDHTVLTFAIRHKYHVKESVPQNYRNYYKGNYDRAKVLIQQTNWTELTEGCIEASWNLFKTRIEDICSQTIPNKKCKQKRSLFMTREALALKKRKDRSFKRYRQTESEEDHRKYKRDRNKLRSLTRKLRTDFEKRLVSDLKRSSKPFWKYCKSRIKSQGRIGKLIKSDGDEALASADKVTEFSQFFASVFTKEDMQNLPAPAQVVQESLNYIDITREKVKCKLLQMNSTKSPGPDNIHPMFMRETADEISYPLYLLFRRSMEIGKLPIDWKTANITPIHKKGSKASAENYRPISLTSQVSKVFESIVRDEIMVFLFENGALSDAQHGFVPGRSCVSQLLLVLEDWTRSIDEGTPIDAIYLDFKKAFDAVAHRRLLITLETIGIRGKLLDWIKDFLTDRLQRVVLEGVASEWTQVTSGVPQGSILGPTLFIAAVYTIPEVVKSSVAIYADDTKLYRAIATPADTEALQNDIDALFDWSEKWQLPFNTKKCKVMHIGVSNPEHEYTIAGQRLEKTTEERDLGLLVDNNMMFHAHAASAVAKAFRTLGVIKRTFMNLDQETLPLLFKTMVRPILEYGNCVWGPIYCGDQDRVERVQRRATKMIAAIRHLPYEERLERLNLPSMYHRRLRGDMITVYQICSGKIRIDPLKLFAPFPENLNTRGHPRKLLVQTSNRASRRQFFSVRVINSWNGLPEDIVMSENTNSFKNKLDKHWKERKFKTRGDL